MKISIMVITLIFSLICKLGFSTYRLVSLADLYDSILASYEKDTYFFSLYESLSFLLTDFIPNIALIISFWYGFTRKNNVLGNSSTNSKIAYYRSTMNLHYMSTEIHEDGNDDEGVCPGAGQPLHFSKLETNINLA